jgi:hypothetical protein
VLGVVVAVSLLAVAEEPTITTTGLFLLFTALCAASLGASRFGDLLNRLAAGVGLIVAAATPWRKNSRVSGFELRGDHLRRLVRDWAAPLALGAAFLALFATANPMVERALTFSSPSGLELAKRLFTWVLTAWFAATLIFAAPPAIRLRNRAPGSRIVARLFSEDATLRALAVFNVLFAVQSATDAAYLWGGASLPAGMTYAQYAHRGAYPLIGAALLAGIVALIVMRPVSARACPGAVRALTLLFMAQTILLVVSAARRLALYVGVYALTPWRVAAFLWMGLVVVGLTLIVVAILRGKSRRWLASTSAAAALATLLAGGALDPGVIADFNLRHSREMGGPGIGADSDAFAALGPSASPALGVLADRLAALGRDAEARRVTERREALLAGHRARMEDWRSRSLRALRLQATLDAGAGAAGAAQ